MPDPSPWSGGRGTVFLKTSFSIRPKKSIFSHNLEHTFFFFLKSGLLEKNNSLQVAFYIPDIIQITFLIHFILTTV